MGCCRIHFLLSFNSPTDKLIFSHRTCWYNSEFIVPSWRITPFALDLDWLTTPERVTIVLSCLHLCTICLRVAVYNSFPTAVWYCSFLANLFCFPLKFSTQFPWAYRYSLLNNHSLQQLFKSIVALNKMVVMASPKLQYPMAIWSKFEHLAVDSRLQPQGYLLPIHLSPPHFYLFCHLALHRIWPIQPWPCRSDLLCCPQGTLAAFFLSLFMRHAQPDLLLAIPYLLPLSKLCARNFWKSCM